jgi:phenylpropionate dioxygenase-like ring-hydroxylating dioxygenase large terminal subunit
MDNAWANKYPAAAVKDSFVPKEDYLSHDFAAYEAERLWPRVWQVACRLEEIPKVGDFVTYEILDDNILIVRTSDTSDGISAFHNVCAHRGRRLVEGSGHVTHFQCRFHGWRYALNGKTAHVVDRHDWKECLTDEEASLEPVHVDSWGGFVFINMSEDPLSLKEFLGPLRERCERFEFEKLRFKWYKTIVVPTNWKVALEAFDESYHVQTTHPQLLEWAQDRSQSVALGDHSMFWYPPEPGRKSRYGPSPRLPNRPERPAREYILEHYEEIYHQLDAMVTPRSYAAAQKLLTEVSADAPEPEVWTKLMELRIKAAQDEGAGWPELDDEYIRNSGANWHMFPNCVYLHLNIDGLLWYRARPLSGNDPNTCLFDVWSLGRYGPGLEPKLERAYYPDYKAVAWGRILAQDFGNIPEVQMGMKSRGFKAARPNPFQEIAIPHFHRTLRQFMADGN